MTKIFGVGLPKTGTLSLSDALKKLGYRSVHNPKSCWKSFIDGDPLFTPIFKHDNGQKFEWDAMVHFAPRHFVMLREAYPDSRFILTVRDMDDWLRSCRRWFHHHNVYKEPQLGIRLLMLGFKVYHEGLFRHVYESHVRDFTLWAEKNLRPEEYLIMNVREGWGPLCRFLDKPVPDSPFPHRHDSHNK